MTYFSAPLVTAYVGFLLKTDSLFRKQSEYWTPQDVLREPVMSLHSLWS